MTGASAKNEPTKVRRNAAVAACIALVWIVADFATKRFFDSGAFSLGEDIAGPFLGLFRFTLVHNTGAAWGIFSDATFALGVFSVAMCIALAAYLVVLDKNASLATSIGVGLVIGGGIGNAIDRFAGSYVVDFIDFTFMDFPVFNVADIGVTCGVAIFIVAMVASMLKEERDSRAKDRKGGEAEREGERE